MEHADCLVLVTAVIDRAAKDADLMEECPHVGGHRVGKCATPIVEGLRAYVKHEGLVDSNELALEFFRLADSG